MKNEKNDLGNELYKEKTKQIMQLNNQFEADVLADVLRDNDIPAIFSPYDDMIFGETFNEFKGWGSVWAEPQYEEQIKDLVEEIRQGAVAEVFDEEVDEDALVALDMQKQK